MSFNISTVTTWSTSPSLSSDIPGNASNFYDEFAAQPPDIQTPLYIEILVGLIQGVIFLIGIFGNIMVILVMIKVKEMRTSTSIFLLNLSIADLLVLLVCQPVALMEFYAKDRWYLGEIICKLVPFMENGVCHVSIMTILAVTAERYCAICHPFRTRNRCTKSAVVRIIVGIWLISSLCTSPFLVMTVMENAVFYDGTPVQVCRTKTEQTWHRVYIVSLAVAFFALPLLILIYMYSKIIKHLVSDALLILAKDDPRAMTTHRARQQVVKMLIFIIILFFVSLSPIRVVTLWIIFTDPKNIMNLGLEGFLALLSAAQIMMYVNSMGNPIIYTLTSTKFKLAFKKVLRGYKSGSTGRQRVQFLTKKSTCEPIIKKGVYNHYGYVMTNGYNKTSTKKGRSAGEDLSLYGFIRMRIQY